MTSLCYLDPLKAFDALNVGSCPRAMGTPWCIVTMNEGDTHYEK